MTDREKIIEIIKRWHYAQSRDMNGHTIWLVDDTERLADALIDSGYGNVAEWKRMAEVAERNDKINERALDNACYDKARTYCPNDDWGCIAKHFKNDYVQRAEREIEEEKGE